MPPKLRMPSLLDKCRTLLQVPRTFLILAGFGRGAAALYPHGRKAKDSRLATIPSTGPTRVSYWSEPHYPPALWQLLFHAHASKPGKLHLSANLCRRMVCRSTAKLMVCRSTAKLMA